MTLGVLSSALFGDMFGTAAMRAAFGEMAFLARCAEVEAALARAQARLGIVPADAAEAISKSAAAIAADPSSLDLDRLEARDRDRRLPDPALGASTGGEGRPRRALSALGRDDAGHHGYRRGSADPRRAQL